MNEMLDRVPPPAVLNKQLGLLCAAMRTIKDQFGHTCENYPACSHAGCIDSYGAWALAETALAAVRALTREGAL